VSAPTVTDLFCGAGGSSTGAAAAGLTIEVAANHWQTAIDVHQVHHPHARHDVADISAADPRRYPVTNILLASPECTNHSQARGVSRRKQDATLFDQDFDPAAEKSRATMWCVVRFAEQIPYDAIVVENVVEATKWIFWHRWLDCLTDLGYEYRVLSHNSMHHGVPQSRDRIYVVFWRKGLRPDLELELAGWCGRCERGTVARQAWKNGRTVGRYRQQYRYACTACGGDVEPGTEPAASIIDWSLDCPRIGDRKRPLAPKTRGRILAGLQRYGWAPITTAGAGNAYERTPGNRARPITAPVDTQQTTSTTAVATPPNFDPLVIPMRNNGNATRPRLDPLGTVTAGGGHHGLLMRNNEGGGEMCTPVTEPARTMTTAGHQSLLMPYYGTSKPHPVDRPIGTVTVKDRHALVDVEAVVDDCGFRMLEPYEVAAAMAFPTGYIPRDLTKRDQVKLAGNAVTPPVMTWITGRLLQALEAAG
jgi:DNA (cytosine-5)-methyltransferase 1